MESGPLARELERLTESWRDFWVEGDPEAMAADVEDRARSAFDAWGLDGGEALDGGVVGLVLAARMAGRDVVLKVLPRGHEEERLLAGEGAALAAWADSGSAVPLLDRRDGGLTLLLERLSPGLRLDQVEVDGEARLRVLAGVVARLHAAGAPAADLDPDGGPVGLREYCEPWRRDLVDRPAEIAELDALLATPEAETVLHLDLHAGNVLSHRGRWVAIDPHAARGDRDAEIWSLIDGLSPVLDLDDEAIPGAVDSFARAAGLNPLRAARWTRLRALANAEMLSREDDLDDDDREWAEGLYRFAAALS